VIWIVAKSFGTLTNNVGAGVASSRDVASCRSAELAYFA